MSLCSWKAIQLTEVGGGDIRQISNEFRGCTLFFSVPYLGAAQSGGGGHRGRAKRRVFLLHISFLMLAKEAANSIAVPGFEQTQVVSSLAMDVLILVEVVIQMSLRLPLRFANLLAGISKPPRQVAKGKTLV